MIDTWQAREQVYSLGRSVNQHNRAAAAALARACNAPAEVRRYLVAVDDLRAAQLVQTNADLGSSRREVFTDLVAELVNRVARMEGEALAVWSDRLPSEDPLHGVLS